jgi:hypothetical protein
MVVTVAFQVPTVVAAVEVVTMAAAEVGLP